MVRQLPLEIKLCCESKSSADKKPSGNSNSHLTDRDEEGGERSRVISIATGPAVTLICRLGPEN